MSSDSFLRKNIIKQRPQLKYIHSGGADKQPHEHSHPEFIFVSNGSGRFETKENQYPIKTGDLIICSKEFTHSEYLFDIEGSNIYHLGFTRTLISGMNEDEIINEPFCIIHTGDHFDLIKTCFGSLLAESEHKQICGKTVEEDLLRVLLIFALRLAVYDIGMAYMSNRTYFEAKEYFDKNFINIKSIEEVCIALNINKFYLTHIFKEQLGMPPIKYLLTKRMEKAKQLLLSSNLSVSDVAAKCGYLDTAYFCRVFRKFEGTTPLQYKIRMRRSLNSD